MTDDLHPTVEACVMRSYCDATFEAAERRLTEIDRLRAALRDILLAPRLVDARLAARLALRDQHPVTGTLDTP